MCTFSSFFLHAKWTKKTQIVVLCFKQTLFQHKILYILYQENIRARNDLNVIFLLKNEKKDIKMKIISLCVVSRTVSKNCGIFHQKYCDKYIRKILDETRGRFAGYRETFLRVCLRKCYMVTTAAVVFNLRIYCQRINEIFWLGTWTCQWNNSRVKRT